MSMLKMGQTLMSMEGQSLRVLELIGEGGQGEVYKVQLEGQKYALKWYHVPATRAQQQWAAEQRKAFTDYLVQQSAPDPRLIWPLAVVEDPHRRTFGYLMELFPERYCGLESLVLGEMRPVPGFRALCRAAIGLSECFRKLHNMGACYKDINLGGPVIDPRNGDVLVCDTDNVRVNKTPGNILFVFFAAPELIRGEGLCQTNTDIHSLAVLLFYLFFRHHPLEGKKELEINVFNEAAQRKFYGRQPVFIYDPDDRSNRPVPGFHDPAIRNWKIYPVFLKELFTRAFTEGLHHPDRRVREGEWMEAFARLRDLLYYCSHCGTGNFLEETASTKRPCWRCEKHPDLPMCLEINDRIIMLNHDTEVFPHHVGRSLDFSQPVAKVSQHPDNPSKWGILNCSDKAWSFVGKGGSHKTCAPGRTVPLRKDLELLFGSVPGQVKARGL